MLLTHDFYKKSLSGKDIADTAKQNGGDFYHVDMGVPKDMIFGYEVLDLDGHCWELIWMNPSFTPQG